MGQLQTMGHEITFDWTIHDAAGKTPEELVGYLQTCAEQDATGVVQADLLFLIDHPACKGAYTELGLAAALDKHIIVVGAVNSPVTGMKQNIFMHLPEVIHVADVPAGIAEVKRLTNT
jgi:nucleoside 2-deoxyribosyltransferase